MFVIENNFHTDVSSVAEKVCTSYTVYFIVELLESCTMTELHLYLGTFIIIQYLLTRFSENIKGNDSGGLNIATELCSEVSVWMGNWIHILFEAADIVCRKSRWQLSLEV